VNFEAVVFDLWQTLVPLSPDRSRYDDMADAIGVPREEFAEVWLSGRREREIGPLLESVHWVFDRLGVESDPQVLVAMRRDWATGALVPRPEALPTLKALRDRGFKLGLITVCSEDVADAWGATPLAEHFDVTVFSCVERVSKPDPRIYELCCERLGVPAEACLFVGDGDNDELPGAERVGMTAVQLRAPGEELSEAGKQWRGRAIERLDEVLELL
jgi:putative hydrolase of the HAD superfamily